MTYDFELLKADILKELDNIKILFLQKLEQQDKNEKS